MADGFARWLKEQLRKGDLSYTSLAARMGVSHSSVRAWALGQSYPRRSSIQRLARALHVPVELVYEQLGWVKPAEDELPLTVQQVATKLDQLDPEAVALIEAVVDQLLARQSAGTPGQDAEP